MTFIVSVSLRQDELNAVETKMKELNLNRHQVLKLAIRRFFFPNERENIPLDGKTASIHKTNGERLEVKQSQPSFIIDLKTGKLEPKEALVEDIE